ncbi:signal peptidase I [Patescibacteria group bacterium]|nr:signal peptidase I [Patescibacteria group bacterium]
MTLFIFLLVFFLFVIIVLINAGLLFLTKKILRIRQATYLKSLYVILIVSLINIVFGFLIFSLQIVEFGQFLAPFIILLVFIYLLKRFYSLKWLNSIIVYFLYMILELIFYLGITFILLIPLRHYVFGLYIVEGDSMNPTLSQNDMFIANKLDKDFSRGEIIVFAPIEKEDQTTIERIIGLPGENIQINDGHVLIDNQLLSEEYLDQTTPGQIDIDLSSNEYFVMGDNRHDSQDSRHIGPIASEQIIGSFFYKYFPY